jgi:integrase
MASVSKSADGKTRILFQTIEGTRRAIYIGACSEKTAANMARNVEHILTAREHNEPLPVDTARYLAQLGDTLYEKLARVGLVEARAGSRTLGAFLDSVLEEKRAEGLKPGSLNQLTVARRKLGAHFGEACRLVDITPSMASAWRSSMLQAGKSLAYVKSITGNAKTLARVADRQKLWGVNGNPFAHLTGGATRTRSERFVTSDDAGRVALAMKSLGCTQESILLFGLARYAGLRCPSETHGLTWSDIDWSRGVMNVRSPKTERYRGHESRVVPIDARLLPLLQIRFDEAQPGETKLITMDKRRFKADLHRACKRAGVEAWEPMTKVLRASCERDFAERGVPQSDLSRLMGHSILVSEKHYLSREVSEKTMRLLGETGEKHPTTRDAKSDAEQAGMGQQGEETGHFQDGQKDSKRADFSGVFRLFPVGAETSKSSASRTRTYNQPVNSRLLYH